MKMLLLVGAALLAVAVSEPAAHAQRVNFNYTGKLVTWTVPKAGTYQITAFGAQGGTCTESVGVVGAGGLGAEIGGDFILTKGEALQIAVGGAGADRCGGGGGGGSFVVGQNNTPLVIAGGGGGGGFFHLGGSLPPGLPGQGGLTGPDGGICHGGQVSACSNIGGGANGNGGPVGCCGFEGGGGGGFFSAGGMDLGGPAGSGGSAFPDLAGGQFGGGFGGGGGAASSAGGGGGYSGGAGGNRSSAFSGPAGGGGSFDAGTGQILVADIQAGNGEVVITKIPPVFAGTPGKANCHGKSVSALAKQYGGLNGAAAALGFDSVGALQEAIQEFCEA